MLDSQHTYDGHGRMVNTWRLQVSEKFLLNKCCTKLNGGNCIERNMKLMI
jgi:hypothetical protein